MADSDLRERAKRFGNSVIITVNEVNSTQIGWWVIGKQITKSATSIGANIHEAQYAQSKDDFISKLEIALKECYETEYWLGVMLDTKYLTEEDYKVLLQECGTIRRMLIKSCTTAKTNI